VRRARIGPAAVAVLALVAAAGCGSSSSAAPQVVRTSTSTTSATRTTSAADRQPNSKLSTRRIAVLQGRLVTVGCLSGAADGVLGPASRAAITEFQTAGGLTADGQYGSATAAKLMADARAKTVVCTAVTTTSTTAAGAAACTHDVILAAIEATGNGKVSLTDFGCDGAWAWAGVDVNTGIDGYEATRLLHSDSGYWSVVDRATSCVVGTVPADVYTPGCTTN
jgi:hypothetical protein